MKSKIGISVLFLSSVALAMEPSLAQKKYEQPLNEVFDTSLVYPQETGEIQLTLFPSVLTGDLHRTYRMLVGFEYGFTDSFQMEIEWDSLISLRPPNEVRSSGIGDVEIGTQYSFMNIRGSNTHAALGFSSSFPSGDIDKELSEGVIEYEPSLILANDFPNFHNLQFFTQVRLALVQKVKERADPAGEDSRAAHEFGWNGGVFMPFNRFIMTAELSWLTNKWNNGGEESRVRFTPGVVWNLPGTWEIGIATPIGFNDSAHDFGVVGIFLYEFILLDDGSDVTSRDPLRNAGAHIN